MRQRAILVVIVASGNSLANFIPPLMAGPWAPSISIYWCPPLVGTGDDTPRLGLTSQP